MKITDKMRLDWLDERGSKSALPWTARESYLGRGYRLHQDNKPADPRDDGHGLTVREAIDAAIRQQKRGGRK